MRQGKEREEEEEKEEEAAISFHAGKEEVVGGGGGGGAHFPPHLHVGRKDADRSGIGASSHRHCWR